MLTKKEFALGFLLTTCKSKFRVGFKPIISDALKSIDKPVMPEPDVTSNTFRVSSLPIFVASTSSDPIILKFNSRISSV